MSYQSQLQSALGRVNAYIEQKMQEYRMPGVAVALTDQQQLLSILTYGYADVAAEVPVTPETLFEIGSIGKSFTSIAILQQHQQGRLDLRAPVARYLPWFEVQSVYEPITIHHCLSHTAGITSGGAYTPSSRYEVWALRHQHMAYAPGSHFYYSNAGYNALGYLLEDLLGCSYEELIRASILEPLGMRETYPAITYAVWERMAVGYQWQRFYDDRPCHPSYPLAPAMRIEYGEGAGSIASTVEDMARYVRMLLKRGRGPAGRVLSRENFRLMIQPVIESGAEAWYGYGFFIYNIHGHTCIGHGGGTLGFTAALLADLEAGLGAVVLVNGPGSPGSIVRFALSAVRAALESKALPVLPPVADPTRVENGVEYVGTYRCGERLLRLSTDGERLVLHHNGEQLVLEQRGEDAFYVGHSDFALFLLRFGRQAGQVVECFHGGDWYLSERYQGPAEFDYPEAWQAYVGHYRSYNPWVSNFHVVLRKGQLIFIFPDGAEDVLVPLQDGWYRCGEEETCPERIRFDTVVDGRALRANLSGGDYYRVFTP